MKKIYKNVLEPIDKQTFHLQKGAKIITAREQFNNICIWFEFDTDIVEVEERTIFVVGTGNTMPQEAVNYLGTAQIHGGNLVFHVYESA